MLPSRANRQGNFLRSRSQTFWRHHQDDCACSSYSLRKSSASKQENAICWGSKNVSVKIEKHFCFPGGKFCWHNKFSGAANGETFPFATMYSETLFSRLHGPFNFSFHVVVLQRTSMKCTKMRAAGAMFHLWTNNIIAFWLCRCHFAGSLESSLVSDTSTFYSSFFLQIWSQTLFSLV